MLELLMWTTILALTGGIFDTVRRWFTLPKRYNSLSDIARDPLGALKNAAQWAVPLVLAGGIPGVNMGSLLGREGLKGVFGSASLKSLFSTKTLVDALPLLSAGASVMSSMEQQKALKAQQQMAEQEARRLEALANQAAAQQAFQQSLPGTTSSSAANMAVDLATILASTAASGLPPTPTFGGSPRTIAQLLNLTEDDLRELIRRSGTRVS